MVDAVTRLDELLVDDPFGAQLEDTMIVAGDLLQSRGQLRGEHIAHELALRGAADEAARRVHAANYAAWIDAHAARLFGALRPLRARRGALRCEFRGGRLRALSLDLRRVIGPGTQLRVSELVELVVAAPAVRHVRELRVRVRRQEDLREVHEALVRAGRALPLELLMISPTTRPLGHQLRGDAVELRERFPRLWFATRFGQIANLLDSGLDSGLVDETTADELARLDGAPVDEALRIQLGRGLSSGRKLTTVAACERLAGLGPSARVFAPILALLLRPQVSHAAAWILPQLPRLGPWIAPQLIPRVRSITGDVANYSVELRCLAGRCLHQLESSSSASTSTAL